MAFIDEVDELIVERSADVLEHLDSLNERQKRWLCDTIKPSYFAEYASHRDDANPLISIRFPDLFGRSPETKAESVRLSRALRKLESAGRIELVVKGSQSMVRWARLAGTS